MPDRAKEDLVRQEEKQLVWQSTYTLDNILGRETGLDIYPLLYQCGYKDVRDYCWGKIIEWFADRMDCPNMNDNECFFIEQAIRAALIENHDHYGYMMLRQYIVTAKNLYVRPILFVIEIVGDNKVMISSDIENTIVKQISGLSAIAEQKDCDAVVSFLVNKLADEKRRLQLSTGRNDWYRGERGYYMALIRRMVKCVSITKSPELIQNLREYIAEVQKTRIFSTYRGDRLSEICEKEGMRAEIDCVARLLRTGSILE